jgi:Putative zinc-finger
MTCPRTVALGAYVLGAVDREERSRLEAHLGTCEICSDELERLAPLPGLLSRLTVDQAEVLDAAEPEPAELDPADPRPAETSAPLERAVFEVARERRRSRLLRATAVAAALVLAAVAVVGGPLLGGDGRQEEPAPLTAGASNPRTGVQGSAELSREPWGTRVDLRLAGVRPGEHCRLVARAAGGRSEVAATWRAEYLGTAEVPGAVAIPPERLTSLDVITADNRVLVRMPVTRD